MATDTNPSSRIFEPMVGSDALFLDPSTGTSNPNPSQSAAAPAAAPHDQSASGSTSQGDTGPHSAQHLDGAGGDETGGSSGGGDNGGGSAPTGENGSGGTGGGGGAGLTDGMTGMLDQTGIPTSGGNGDLVSNLGDTVGHAVGSGGAAGSGGPLNILGGNDILHGLDNVLGTSGLSALASNLGNDVVSDLGQTVGAIGNGGNLNDVLHSIGNGVGALTDDVLNGVSGAAGNGILGGVLGGLGSDVVNGTVGGSGLLKGTPLDGIEGNGALVSTNAMQGDHSSPSSLIQVGAGTDPSKGLINVDAASNHNGSSSNNIVDTNIGPQTSGNGASADLLGANPDSTGALINADAGHHQGPTLVGVNAGTNADQFQFPALNGIGADSLVGQVGNDIGQVAGSNPIDTGGANLLPLSAGVDGHALADIGAAGAIDSGSSHVNDGTHVMVNTPVHGGLV